MKYTSKIILIVFLFFMSCFQAPEKLLIKEEKLVQVLADVHFAEAAINHLAMREKEKTAELYYEQIFKIQEIEKADFDSCMAMLKKNTVLMHTIYSQVMDELDRRKAEIKQ